MPAASGPADRSRPSGGPGANPIEFVTHSTSTWTLVGLRVTLSVTPLRRLTGRAEFIRYRRMLGVVHYWWLVKKDLTQPLVFGTALVLLLVLRLPWGLSVLHAVRGRLARS